MIEQPYTELAPPADLAAYVDRFWLSTTLRAAARRHRVLPDGCIDVLVDASRARARVVGAMTRAIEVPATAGALIAVRFKPGTGAAIARCALDALTDRDAALDELGLAGDAIAARIADAASTPARLALLTGWVRRRLADAPPPDPLAVHAVARLASPALADARIDDVARELGVTRQHLARVFRREVGVTPKQLARIARLQRTTDALAAPHGRDLARLAVELGYFDQAHLANDVRALAGISPGALAAERPTALAHLYAAPVPFLQARARRTA